MVGVGDRDVTRGRSGFRGQSGAALPAVLALLVLGITLTMAALAFASTGFRAGTAYQRRAATMSSERDALAFLVQSIRPDRTKGVEGDTQTVTVAGVTATCVGETGSGQASGEGRTDRVIACSTPSIRARYRIFDRSGDKPGISVETLSKAAT